MKPPVTAFAQAAQDRGCVLAVGLSSAAMAEDPTGVGITVGSLGNPYFVVALKGIEARAKEITPGAKTIAASSDWDLNKQFTRIDDFIGAGAQVIMVNTADPVAIAPALMIASTAARRYCRLIRGSASFPTNLGAMASRDGGFSVGRSLLTRFPHIEAAFCINDPTAIGLSLAARQQNHRDFFITSADGAPEIVREIKNRGRHDQGDGGSGPLWDGCSGLFLCGGCRQREGAAVQGRAAESNADHD